MERIVIFARTTKTEGDIKLRFRLTDGRRADLYHKSNIKASLADLSKFNVDGSLRPKVSVYNKELEDSITREIDAMRRAYRKMVEAGGIITAVKFEEEVAKELNPEVIIRKEEKTLLSVLHKYIEDGYRDGLFVISRYKHFNGLHNRMERYFKINGLEQMTPAEFDADEIMKFRQFLFDEYLYVPKHKRIYKDLKKLEIPTKRRGSNTVAQEVKMLITFFNYLEVRDEIVKSPFRRMSRDCRKKITQTKEDDPFFLTINAVHETLQAQAAHAVNLALTARNWLIGYYIVEFEQHGEDRAAYGEKLLKKLESRIIGKGMNERRFRDFRRLYLTYPQLAVPVVSYVANNSEIRRLATAEFTEETQSADTQAISIPADRLLVVFLQPTLL